MIDPSSLLRAGDPLRDESGREGLSADDARAIRQTMIAAIPDGVELPPVWRRPMTIAAAAALIASVSGAVGHRFLTRAGVEEPMATAGVPVSAPEAERRQLQFATPGGTRIIWTFDDSLRLQEPIP